MHNLNHTYCKKSRIRKNNYYSPPKKYKGFKVANTGIDPHGNFVEFIKKDIIKNIDVHRDS